MATNHVCIFAALLLLTFSRRWQHAGAQGIGSTDVTVDPTDGSLTSQMAAQFNSSTRIVQTHDDTSNIPIMTSSLSAFQSSPGIGASSPIVSLVQNTLVVPPVSSLVINTISPSHISSFYPDDKHTSIQSSNWNSDFSQTELLSLKSLESTAIIESDIANMDPFSQEYSFSSSMEPSSGMDSFPTSSSVYEYALDMEVRPSSSINTELPSPTESYSKLSNFKSYSDRSDQSTVALLPSMIYSPSSEIYESADVYTNTLKLDSQDIFGSFTFTPSENNIEMSSSDTEGMLTATDLMHYSTAVDRSSNLLAEMNTIQFSSSPSYSKPSSNTWYFSDLLTMLNHTVSYPSTESTPAVFTNNATFDGIDSSVFSLPYTVIASDNQYRSGIAPTPSEFWMMESPSAVIFTDVISSHISSEESFLLTDVASSIEETRTITPLESVVQINSTFIWQDNHSSNELPTMTSPSSMGMSSNIYTGDLNSSSVFSVNSTFDFILPSASSNMAVNSTDIVQQSSLDGTNDIIPTTWNVPESSAIEINNSNNFYFSSSISNIMTDVIGSTYDSVNLTMVSETSPYHTSSPNLTSDLLTRLSIMETELLSTKPLSSSLESAISPQTSNPQSIPPSSMNQTSETVLPSLEDPVQLSSSLPSLSSQFSSVLTATPPFVSLTTNPPDVIVSTPFTTSFVNGSMTPDPTSFPDGPITANLSSHDLTASDLANDTDSSELETTVPTSNVTSEWVLNISDAYAQYWVKTVLTVPLSINVGTFSFRREMETKFATVYNEAIELHENMLQGRFSSLRRRKRAVTVGNATIQMTNITRDNPDNPDVTLVYYLIEDDPDNNITEAGRTVGLIELFSDQELAIKLGYPVVLKAEAYIPPPPPEDKRLWIIGAVIGGLAGFLFLVWLSLFIYCKCTRPQQYSRSPRNPRGGKVGDLDSMEYRTKDVKGFDYVRTAVGMENEGDRRKSSEYYRRYPTGSSDFEGMYSRGDTPPPSFNQPDPSRRGSSARGSKGEPTYPPPAPPLNGYITASTASETQSKPVQKAESQSKRNKKAKQSKHSDVEAESVSTVANESDLTQDTERSEDRQPLKKSGQRRRKTKTKGNRSHNDSGAAGDFENVAKMGRSEEVDGSGPPIRTTVHPIKAPVLPDDPGSSRRDPGDEIPTTEDVEDTLRQKADLERWRNKQRLRDKRTGSKKHSKSPVGDSKDQRRAYHKARDDLAQVLQNGHPAAAASAQQKKKKKRRKRPDADDQRVDKIELQPVRAKDKHVEDPRAIKPVLAGMQAHPTFGQMESDDSSDEELHAARNSGNLSSHEKARQLVNALLDEAFAMVSPDPESNDAQVPDPASQRVSTPRIQKPPPPTAVMELGPQHTPLYITPVNGRSRQPSTTWNPYTASDEASHILPPGGTQVPPLLAPGPHISQQPSRTPPQPPHPHPHPAHPLYPEPRPPLHYTNPAYSTSTPPQPTHPRAPLQYSNPAYSGDTSVQLGSRAIPETSLDRPANQNAALEVDPKNSAFTPYQRPNWAESIPRAWAGAEDTLLIGGRRGDVGDDSNLSGQNADNKKSNALDLSRFHVPEPVKRDAMDDEIDIVSDVVRSGKPSQPLIDSIREEIQRLAMRSQENDAIKLQTSSYA